MKQYRVWFGFCGEVYAGEDPACPSYWSGSGVYDIFEDKVVLAVADIWCKEENIEEQLWGLVKKEFDEMNVDDIQIVKYAWTGNEDNDSPEEYVDDWHSIKERDGSMGNLDMCDFVKSWDLRKKVYPGDIFDVNGRMVEIL